MESASTTSFAHQRPEAKLKDYVAVLMRRRTIIAVSFLSVLATTAYYVSRIEDVYESYSTVVIEDQNAFINQSLNYSGKSMSFYRGILDSRTFLEAVVDSIGLDVFSSLFPKISKEEAINYVSANLTLKPTNYDLFIRINARGKSKDLAYLMARIGTEIFRKRCHEVETEELRRSLVEIENQLGIIRRKLEEAEKELQAFNEKSGAISEKGLRPELSTLQIEYANGLAQLGLKEANLEAEKKQLAKLEEKIAPKERANSPEYIKLRSQLQELEKERMRLENLGIRFSGISTIDREIEEIEKNLLTYKQPTEAKMMDPRIIQQWQSLRKSVINKEDELDLFKRQLESYRTAIENYRKRNPDILSQSLELLRLKRAKEINENLYNILLEKAEETRIRNSSTSAGIKIVDIARRPEKPIPKNEVRFYIIGVLLGLALGIGVALLIEYNDTSIKSNDDVERYLGVPILGTIPHISYNKKDELEIRRRSSWLKGRASSTSYPKNLLDFQSDDSVATEAYRSLRTNLTFSSPDKPLHTVLVTSAGPSEGKSLTISNLALAYAQMGKKTLLVDTDLRRPVLHHLFTIKREPGFSDLFVDGTSYDHVIRTTAKHNLYVVSAGTFTPNPAELIASQKMLQHLEYFKDNFDIIFFDTPPVVAVTDAMLLGNKVDGVLLVIKSHRTDKIIAQRAINMLSGVKARIIGTVLNDINLSHHYSSYGYYKYYYHYYKSKTQ